MNYQDERYRANRFSVDVDRLLEQQGRIEAIPVLNEHAELVDLAESLIDLDFSANHPLRERLRQNLMAHYRQDLGYHRQWVRNGWRLRWRPAAIGLIAVLLCLILLALIPSTRTLAQEAWQAVLHTVQLIRTVPQVTDNESDPVMEINSPAEAVPLVNFPVYVPSYLPQGYHFRFGGVSRAPQQRVFFDYGIPAGRIILLPNGQAVSSRTYKGLRLDQMKGEFPGPWPIAIGEATVEEVTVGSRPALWLTGLPIVQSQVSVTARITTVDGKVVEQESLSRREAPPEILIQTSVTALMWEEGDRLLTILDLDGRFPLTEMQRIAEGLVSISAPTPTPEMTHQAIASLEEMTTTASFSPYVFTSLPEGWRVEKITAYNRSDNPLERWYTIQYQHTRGASIRLIEGLIVPLQFWPNYIEGGGGTLRHTAVNGLEVWTSELHQETYRRDIKETARLNGRPIPQEVQAMFLRAPDGLSLELIAIGVSWDEILSLIELITLAPGADPTLNSRLMKGCYPCP